jgi:hypothetical protein
VSPTNHFPTEKPLKFHLVMVKGVDVRMMWLKRNLLVGKDAEGSIMSTMIKRSNEDNSEEENDGDGDADDNDARVKETSYFVRREGTSIDEGTERPEERG